MASLLLQIEVVIGHLSGREIIINIIIICIISYKFSYTYFSIYFKYCHLNQELIGEKLQVINISYQMNVKND